MSKTTRNTNIGSNINNSTTNGKETTMKNNQDNINTHIALETGKGMEALKALTEGSKTINNTTKENTMKNTSKTLSANIRVAFSKQVDTVDLQSFMSNIEDTLKTGPQYKVYSSKFGS